MGVVSE